MGRPKLMHLNRRYFLGGSAAFATLPISAHLSASVAGAEYATVDDAAREMVSQKYTPGLAIAVMRDGVLEYSGSFGSANLETQTPVNQGSVFKIASITKQMTAASILLLQEDAKLHVEDRLSQYIPEFPRADEITLYQLATHTAGLGSFNRLPTRNEDRMRDYDDADYLDLMKRTDPLFVDEPGNAERYSNTDYGLLGIIISRVSGMHYSEFFQQRLFDRLGLSKTRFDNAYEVIPRRVSGYSPNTSQPSGFERARYTSPSYPGPSGGVVSTAEELCNWHCGLVFGGLLKPESRDIMTAPVQLPSAVSYYGMGVRSRFSRTPFEGRNVVSHGGRIFGFATDLWSFPEKGVTVATLLNSDGGDLEGFGRRFDGVRDPATQIGLREFQG